jgi:hypothetical protein
MAHSSIASCVLRQVMSTCVTSPPEILYFQCQDGFSSAADGAILPKKLRKGEPLGALIILKSFISQALRRGFGSAKTPCMNTSHNTLLDYLVETFGSMLETKDCSVLLVVDSIEHMLMKDLSDFLECLNCLTEKHAKRCSVLLGGETTVQLIKGLDGLPFVNEETEVKGRALFHGDNCHTIMYSFC